jgi:adenosylcobinamide-phosphate synthase
MDLAEPVYIVDYWALGSIPLGIALDLLLPKRPAWPNPVQGIVRLIRVADRGLRVAVSRARGGPKIERWAGLVLTMVIVGLVGSLVLLLTDILRQLNGPATLIGRGLMIYWGLAFRSLGMQTLQVTRALNLPQARRDFSILFGRDTAGLDATGIDRACVEQLGEKIHEAVVAPLFWLALLGPAGLWAYKASTTLYGSLDVRSVRDNDFTWAARKLDSLLNGVPARLTWLLISISAELTRADGLGALKIGWRDGRKSTIPGQWWGLATFAGALGVQLGGPASFGGLRTSRPIVGDPILPLDRRTVLQAIRIYWIAGLHAAALSLLASPFFLGN